MWMNPEGMLSKTSDRKKKYLMIPFIHGIYKNRKTSINTEIDS